METRRCRKRPSAERRVVRATRRSGRALGYARRDAGNNLRIRVVISGIACAQWTHKQERGDLAVTTTTTRDSRLFVRADQEEKARIELAASLSRQNVSEFIRTAVEDRAELVLAEQRSTVLDEETFDALTRALDAPSAPSQALRDAARAPRRFLQK